MQTIFNFIKQICCYHYWDAGVSVKGSIQNSLSTFTCVKCKKQKVKGWAWGQYENRTKFSRKYMKERND
jgi:hypothetical protein